ncbi:hypothetical protein ATL42_1542 [Sanguibacter antarcticus]|uniref:Uncharacterized protein n=1 Tax=Sanguibacter antarcticus TaxID=372484 RepID=A0A2A9E3P7_9MICO|nr:hypothetical protein ATL42_1542 [Sanguibacter antarcticus]
MNRSSVARKGENMSTVKTHAAHRDAEAYDLDLRDLPDVSALLARLLDERIPLALMADLASPHGPRSAEILESERDE